MTYNCTGKSCDFQIWFDKNPTTLKYHLSKRTKLHPPAHSVSCDRIISTVRIAPTISPDLHQYRCNLCDERIIGYAQQRRRHLFSHNAHATIGWNTRIVDINIIENIRLISTFTRAQCDHFFTEISDGVVVKYQCKVCSQNLKGDASQWLHRRAHILSPNLHNDLNLLMLDGIDPMLLHSIKSASKMLIENQDAIFAKIPHDEAEFTNRQKARSPSSNVEPGSEVPPTLVSRKHLPNNDQESQQRLMLWRYWMTTSFWGLISKSRN